MRSPGSAPGSRGDARTKGYFSAWFAVTPSLVFRQTPVEGAPPHPCEGVRGSAPLSPQVTRPPLPRLYQPHDPPRHACSRSQRSRSCRRLDNSCCRAAALVFSTRPTGELCPRLVMHASPLFLRLADPARPTGAPRARRFAPIDVYFDADGCLGPSRSSAGGMWRGDWGGLETSGFCSRGPRMHLLAAGL